MRLKQFGLSIVAASAASLALAASASAGPPTGDYAQFNHCPVNNALVTSCLYSEVTSGSFKLGTSTVPINKKIVLQGGIYSDENFNINFVNAVGADTLSKTGLDVPGGLLGIMQGSGFTGVLLAAFEAAVHSANGVTATAELVGPVQINLINFIIASGTALTLPVRIHLENPFLGSNCYIGSPSTPVNLAMTTGTTAPPAPNTPISGNPGTTVLFWTTSSRRSPASRWSTTGLGAGGKRLRLLAVRVADHGGGQPQGGAPVGVWQELGLVQRHEKLGAKTAVIASGS